MDWLRRIWSKVWVEQRIEQTPKSNSQSPSETLPNNPKEQLILDTDLFHLSFSDNWSRVEVEDPNQFCFDHSKNNIGLVISAARVNVPPDKMKPLAEFLVETSENGLKSNDPKDEIIFSDVGVTEHSWGFQARVTRIFINNVIFRYFALVSPTATIHLTFETLPYPENSFAALVNSFDSEVEKVFASLRFSDEFWGDRNFPEGSRIQ